VNIEKALTVEGWMSEVELIWLAKKAASVPQAGTIAEIGSYLGRSASALAANTQATVYCVDMWNHSWDGWVAPPGPHSPNFDRFRANTAEFANLIPVNCASVFAAHEFAAAGRRFDLIFIDAAHDEHNVRQDIHAWQPLLAENGILCGHDYGHGDWPAVKIVVDELFPGAEVVDSIWVGVGGE
jgi:hypothetical protein